MFSYYSYAHMMGVNKFLGFEARSARLEKKREGWGGRSPSPPPPPICKRNVMGFNCAAKKKRGGWGGAQPPPPHLQTHCSHDVFFFLSTSFFGFEASLARLKRSGGDSIIWLLPGRTPPKLKPPRHHGLAPEMMQ